MGERQAHWEQVYETRGERDVSWFQETPVQSLDLIRRAGVPRGGSIIDVGGGASRLVDELLKEGFDVAVLDLSAAALEVARSRLGAAGEKARWIVADATKWAPDRQYDLWHDRAAFHFLTDPGDRAAYVARLATAVKTGGHAMIATFAPDGPEKCSGLPVVRHDAESLGGALGERFVLIETRRGDHPTPSGAHQAFQFSLFRKRA